MQKNHQLICRVVAVCAFVGMGAGVRAADISPGKEAPLPFVVYDEKGSTNNHYAPSGWMGNTKGIKLDEGCTNYPHSGKTCCRFEYTGAGDWAGIAWQDPANDWGDQPGGWNLTGAKRLTFWARGENGGEIVTFKFGILGADKKNPDSATGELDGIPLAKDWKEYTIDLAGKDLTRIKTGFVCVLGGQGQSVTLYLDAIRYE